MKKLMIAFNLMFNLTLFGAEGLPSINVETRAPDIALENNGTIVQLRIAHVREVTVKVPSLVGIMELRNFGGIFETIDENFNVKGQTIACNHAQTLFHQPKATIQEKVEFFKLAQLLGYPSKQNGGHITIQ